jgi:hypothetical protein
MTRAFRTMLCIAVLACWNPAMAGEGATVRFASARTRQPMVETPLPEEPVEPELLPPSNDEENRGDADEILDEQVSPGTQSGSTQSGSTQNPFDYGTMYGSGLPASPYIAGLSYMKTPQPFRVPYTNRFYYPCPHFVRRCPYYPKGMYWGANWNRVLLPPNNLAHGAFRFNPYLSRLNAQKQGTYGHLHTHGHHHGHCPPVVIRSVSTDRSGTVEDVDEASAADEPTLAGRLAPDDLRPQRE